MSLGSGVNLTLSIASGVSGIAMFVAGIYFKDIAAGFNGLGAVTIALVLYQQSDMKSQIKELKDAVKRVENYIFDKAKMNREGL